MSRCRIALRGPEGGREGAGGGRKVLVMYVL